jgi:O-antigen/teichoic acid export membrane protein
MNLSIPDLRMLWAQGQRLWGVLRLAPFDESTVEGRSKERYRRIGLSTVAALVAKVVGVLTGLISVPLTVGYLGTERYGLWMTISSVIILMSFADMGIGNGLINAIIASNGRDDRSAAQESVSSAFFMFSGIGALIAASFALAYPFIPWPQVFNVSSALAAKEAGPAVAVFVGSFALAIPLGVVQRVQVGFQEGFKNSVWQCAGSVIGLICVVAAIELRLGLPWLVLAMSGGTTATIALNWAVQFLYARPWLRPRWQAFRWRVSHALLGTGSIFFILQIMALIGSSSDNIVLAQLMGPGSVAIYSVAQKLFSLTLLAQFVIAPLWPAFGDALERNELGWARRTFMRAIILALLFTVLTVVPLLLVGHWIVVIWAGKQVAPPFMLLVSMALWAVLAAYGGVMSVLLNNRTLLRKQLIFYSAASLSSLALKIALTPILGISGVVWATIIGYCVFYVAPAGFLAKRELWRPDVQMDEESGDAGAPLAVL